ncbi:hypothetical protein C3L33_08701, partial [Rhododendron williamsianum]
MAPRNVDGSGKKVYNKGAWTSEEDRKLTEYIDVHGPKKWKTIATKSGRLPGRTDNEIKNYWNSHLSKKISCENEKTTATSAHERGRRKKSLAPSRQKERERKRAEAQRVTSM